MIRIAESQPEEPHEMQHSPSASLKAIGIPIGKDAFLEEDYWKRRRGPTSMS
jgi:hypothetical protein